MAVTCGVPQGSVLGPLLFLLYVNDLPYRISARVTMFADDTNVLESFSQSDQSSLKNSLHTIDEWMKYNKLKCNLDKSKAIIFGNKEHVLESLKSESIVLKEASNVKYLGVLVDEELTFKDHVELVKKKLNKCFYAVLKSRQVLTQSQMLVYYKTHVKPIIQYGVLIYGGTMYSNLQPILKMQKKIVRCIFHLRFSTSVKEVMNSNKIHTVYELYLYEITNFMLKCLKNEHCIEFLNSMITQKTTSCYELRVAERAHVSITRNKHCKNSLSHRVPKFFNKLNSWGVLPNKTSFESMTNGMIDTYCNNFMYSYILGNQELVDFLFDLNK